MHTHEAEFTLGTLLRLGARDTHKITGMDFRTNLVPFYGPDDEEGDLLDIQENTQERVTGACARGAIALAGAYLEASQEGDPCNAERHTSVDAPLSVINALRTSITSADLPPEVPLSTVTSVQDMITGLNDQYGWSRGVIADVLDALTERGTIPTVTLPVQLDRLYEYGKTDWLEEAEYVKERTVGVDEEMPSGDSVPEADAKPELAVAEKGT